MKQLTWNRLWPVGLIIIIGSFFWLGFLNGGKVLLPADLLVGSYYPWLENKWGYEVSVPYKNPLLSDAYSQLFVWKKLVAEAYKSGEWPLWNQYSYSGYPLLANMQSAALYPLNLLFIVLPFNMAWNLYLISGTVLSSLAMYWLLKTYGRKNGSAVLGGLMYGFCAYSLSWMEFATVGQAMIWLPLMIMVVEKYFKSKKMSTLMWLAPLILMSASSGNFQISFYSGVVTTLYFGLRMFRKLVLMMGVGILGLGLSAMILLPGWEMAKLSVRNKENIMTDLNYGLVPINQFITLVAPDFYGNPATGNYRGFINYQETLICGGVLMAIAWLWGVFEYKKLEGSDKFFVVLGMVTFFMFFDGPVGRFVYGLNLPGISTSGAGRIAVLYALSGVALTSKMIEVVATSRISFFKSLAAWGALMAVTGGILLYSKNLFVQAGSNLLENDINSINISLRNIVIPIIVFGAIGVSVFVFKKTKYLWLILMVFVMGESARFVNKYVPVSEAKYVFPQTQITDYLMKDKEIFRVEKEKGSLLSPNTWIMYGLQSPSGYDPMGLAEYTNRFYQNINGEKENYSRYTEIERFDSKVLGEYNVKYLLALKMDEKGKYGGNRINYKIDKTEWEKVFETNVVAVMKNKNYSERARILDGKGEVKITEYKSNLIKMNYTAETDSELVVTDTWYPGWKVWVNGEEKSIDKYNDVFRKVNLAKGSGVVEMRYVPDSFRWGKIITLGSLAVWFGMLLWFKKNKKNDKRI